MEIILPIEISSTIITVDKVCRNVCIRWRDIYDKFANEDEPNRLPYNLLRDSHFAIINNDNWVDSWHISEDFALLNIYKIDWLNIWDVRCFSQNFVYEFSRLTDPIVKMPNQIIRFYDGDPTINLFMPGRRTKIINVRKEIDERFSTLICSTLGHYSITIRFQRDFNMVIEEYTIDDFGVHHDIKIRNQFDSGYILNIAVIELKEMETKHTIL